MLFLDGSLHIYDVGRAAVKMGVLLGIVTAAEERVDEKEKFRGTLTSEDVYKRHIIYCTCRCNTLYNSK